MADPYGANSEQVVWVLGRLEQLGVADWRALGDLTRDTETEERLQDAIAEVKARGAGELVRAVFDLADEVAERATSASQAQRGQLKSLEIPVSASGWTGEIEGTRVEYLAPEDRYPFRQAARDVLMLAAMRPDVAAGAFEELWSRFEGLIGLEKAERDGVVAGLPD